MKLAWCTDTISDLKGLYTLDIPGEIKPGMYILRVEWYRGSKNSYDKWCSSIIQKNGGIHTLAIPANVTAGEYYLRTEISDSNKTDPEDLLFTSAKPQFYVDCITLNIASSYSDEGPKNFISIPWDKKGSGSPNPDDGLVTIMNDSMPTDSTL
ncbi:hypothetical protein H4218_002167 [Coemansia sp. IMI 209128]|nr:hypothetical protein H4218_002167 [Coemansia sp. IMI 209128]